jgi:hypothetical protein
MSWSYRVVRYGNGYGLHEVHYDEDGLAWTMTENPISFACGVHEGPLGIVDSLSNAHGAAKNFPVFDEPENGKWLGKAPELRASASLGPLVHQIKS